jgi:hypothetical protein
MLFNIYLTVFVYSTTLINFFFIRLTSITNTFMLFPEININQDRCFSLKFKFYPRLHP